MFRRWVIYYVREQGKLHETMGSYCGFQFGVVVGWAGSTREDSITKQINKYIKIHKLKKMYGKWCVTCLMST